MRIRKMMLFIIISLITIWSKKSVYAADLLDDVEIDIRDDNVARERLSVEVKQGDTNVLIKSDSIFYTNKDVSFYPDMSDMCELINTYAEEIEREYITNNNIDGEGIDFNVISDLFFGAVIDGGNIEEMTDEVVTFNNGGTTAERERTIKFMKTLSVTVMCSNDEIDEIVAGTKDLIMESDLFTVVFDNSSPSVLVEGEKDEEGLYVTPAIANIMIEDGESGIKHVVISSGEEVFADINLKEKGRIVKFTNEISLPIGLIKDSVGKIDIMAEDNVGNVNEYSIEFISDTQNPSAIILGPEDGRVYADATQAVFQFEDNQSGLVLVYKCKYIDTEGNENIIEEINQDYAGSKGEMSRVYTKEGVYEVTFICRDKYGNESDLLYRSFGIDKESPSVFFDGIKKGDLLSGKVNLGINVKELFYEGMKVDVKVVNVNNNVYTEVPVGSYSYGAVNNKNTYSFNGSGNYRVMVEAIDKCGHKAQAETEFTIDESPPEVSIVFNDEAGVSSALLNEIPSIYAVVKDRFYDGINIKINLAKKMEGNIIENIPVSIPKMNTEEIRIPININSEGIYELSVSATDGSGNTAAKGCSFTIDESPPVIGYISDFNERYLKSFNLPENLQQYINDMTDVSYKTYLNSKETGYGEIKKDGKYILQVVAWDSAGNESEETIAFIIDNTKPSVVISGLNENGEITRESPVTLSLYNSDDYFTEVFVNGYKQTLSKDRKQCEFSYDDIQDPSGVNEVDSPYGNGGIKNNVEKKCRIYVSARDAANNVLTQTIERKCAIFLASPFDLSLDSGDAQTLTKTMADLSIEKDIKLLPNYQDEILHNSSPKFSATAIWVICGLLCVFTAILVGFAFVDSVRNKC